MVIRKRCLLWDWTNTRDIPSAIEQLNFSPDSPFHSVANWNPWVPPEVKGRLPFRPTLRTPAQLEGNDWAMVADYERNRHELVYYFNEPERIPGCTPELAADKWRAQVVPLLRDQQGRKLVGPAVASDDAGRAWLRRFMGLVADCMPDYLGVHYYGTAAGEAIAYISSMHAEWPALPVVLSEVASISRAPGEVERFTAELANWLDETAWVYEYAFFGCMNHCADDFVSPAAQLMDKEGKFTPLMTRLTSEQPMQV